MKSSAGDTLTDIGVIKPIEEVSYGSEGGKVKTLKLSLEDKSLTESVNKLEGTAIFTDMEYIKGPGREVIVVNSKPTRGDRNYEDIEG